MGALTQAKSGKNCSDITRMAKRGKITEGRREGGRKRERERERERDVDSSKSL